jgi:hypothetical protein
MARCLTGCCRLTLGSCDLDRLGVGGKRGIWLACLMRERANARGSVPVGWIVAGYVEAKS